MYSKDTPNVVTTLKKAGYRTGIIGKLHVNPESAFPFDFKAIPRANMKRQNMGAMRRMRRSSSGRVTLRQAQGSQSRFTLR
jgi:arylsulfatase A-like enzyme